MKKIIKRIIFVSLSAVLIFLTVPGEKISAANMDGLGITCTNFVVNFIFANGNSIIIADNDGNADTATDTIIYLDTDNDGELDESEKVPVDLTAKGIPASYGSTSTGYDLSSAHIIGGCLGHTDEYTVANSVSKTKITMIGGTVLNVFGGSKGFKGNVDEDADVTISGSSHVIADVTGGGEGQASVKGNANIVIKDSAKIDGSVLGCASGGGSVTGNTNIRISGSASIGGSVYGAGINSVIQGMNVRYFAVYKDTYITVQDNATISGNVVGGGSETKSDGYKTVAGNTHITLSGSAKIGQSVWGGGLGYGKAEKAFINISDGVSVAGSVNGGSNTSSAAVTGAYIINQPAKTITVSGDITLPQNVTVASDQTMTILNDSVLRIPSGMTLENNGIVINNKIIVNNGTISGSGILKNLITYVLRGGVNDPANTDYYAYGTGLTLADPTYSSQLFGGWYTNSDCIQGSKVVSFGSNELTAKTIYAKWINPLAHAVTYHANGATGGTVPTDSNAYVAGTNVPLAGNTGSLTKTGFTFGGWSTTAGGTALTSYYTMGTAPATFYAVWNPIPTYAVIYHANGATGGTVPTDSNAYVAGTNVPLAGNTGSLTKTGFTFGGWSTTAGGTALTSYTMGTAPVTFYAVWDPVASENNKNSDVRSSTVTGQSILDSLNAALNGATVGIDMNGSTMLRREWLESIVGRDVSMLLNMGNGVTWTINGKGIIYIPSSDIDFEVKIGTKNIPKSAINQIAGGNDTVEFSIPDHGPLGFKALLGMKLDEKYKGKIGSVYYYDDNTGGFQLTSPNVKLTGATATFDVKHFSDYVIVISKDNIDSQELSAGASAEADETTLSAQTDRISHIFIAVIILASALAAVIRIKYKKYRDSMKP